MNPDNVFEDICYGFKHMPSYCRKLLKQEHLLVNSGKGVSSKELGIVLGVILVINFVLFLVYRKYLNDELDHEMKMQVSSEVSRYVALSQIKDLSNPDANSTDISIDSEVK